MDGSPSSIQAFERRWTRWMRDGKHYPTKSPADINGGLPLEDVREYMLRVLSSGKAIDPEKVAKWMPYETTTDYITTLREAASGKDSVFRWPSQSILYAKGLCVALDRIVPGVFFAIKNGHKIPPYFLEGGSGTTEPNLRHGVKEVFHGTTLQWLPNILHSGFKATVGSGCDSAAWHFGTVVSGVYLAISIWR